MKHSAQLRAGDSPHWELQHRARPPPPCLGAFPNGTASFIDAVDSCAPHRAQLRTFSEKFAHAAYVPIRPEDASAPRLRKTAPEGILRQSSTWGIDGTLPRGTRRVPAPTPTEADWGGKRHLDPGTSIDLGGVWGKDLSSVTSVQRHRSSRGVVRDAAGTNVSTRRSDEFSLSDALQRKGRDPLPYELGEKPPGLRGLGAEYQVGYWALDGVVPRTRLRPTREGQVAAAMAMAAARASKFSKTKSFKEREAEDEIASQRALVSTLALEHEYIDDDEDRC